MADKYSRTKEKYFFSRKREIGSEKDMTPLSAIHDHPSIRKLVLSRIAIILTIVFWVLYILSIIIRQLIDSNQGYNFTVEAFAYALIVSFLTFSALLYLITRLGAFERFSKHVRVSHSILVNHFSKSNSDITVLVPSYNEEPSVVRKTLLSAALQEYPHKRVVLLIDDKPYPTEPSVLARLNETRAIPSEIEAILAEPYDRFTKALNDFKKLKTKDKNVSNTSVLKLASHYKWAVNYLNNIADKEEISDHVDVFFVNQVLHELAKDLELISEALIMSAHEAEPLSREYAMELYQRLTWIFGCKLNYFERKKYVSLSQEINKAMNLNSYIGLMGGTYHKEQTPEGNVLIPVKEKHSGDIIIPDSEFLLTLDADSILLRDYCMRLVYFLQQPGNERIAVTQTPYSSFRGAFSRIERIAGGTTDVQHILHQGMSQYGATFWVGANAIIRKRALEDIEAIEYINGFEIKRYIQDRTVIEDTESSIDLTIHGWKLMNYPERLSYSATPPDFGSLVIQRRRWANGGLLILPKLWTMIRERKRRGEVVSWMEIMIRLNYLASIAWSSISLVFLLAYPFNGHLLSTFVLLTALPYFISQAIDLRYCRYSYFDIFGIYGFNLILLPVNLAGVFKSIEQALTDEKIPFARTPKIKNRTVAGLLYVVVPVAIVLFSIYIFIVNVSEKNWGNAAYAGFNAVAATFAIFAYIGIWNLITDFWIGLTGWFFVESKPKTNAKKVINNQQLNWKAVLYHGENSGTIPYMQLDNIAANSLNINETKKS